MSSTSLEECLTLLDAERDGAPLRAPQKGEKRSRKMAGKFDEKAEEKTCFPVMRRVGAPDSRAVS